eukprot:904253-Pleurochrysis_carterae.AAC.1
MGRLELPTPSSTSAGETRDGAQPQARKVCVAVLAQHMYHGRDEIEKGWWLRPTWRSRHVNRGWCLLVSTGRTEGP